MSSRHVTNWGIKWCIRCTLCNTRHEVIGSKPVM